ncbi:MAG TPA: histidinol dehydrogenase, partial [Rhodospirillaceae bacterium]|nr:histidinol dehydrogenase [Rhodospirillaceae bacterium]
MAQRLDIRTSGFETAFSAMLAAKQLRTSQVDEAVADILAEVKEGGDAALIAFSKRFDGNNLTPETMRVEADELQRAAADCDSDVLAALELAAARISDFHRRQMPDDLD